MANFYGTGRSNYVRCTDIKKWEEICETYGLTFIQQVYNDKTLVGFTTENTEDGNIPDFDDEDNSVDPLAELAAIMVDGEVLVFQLAGAEKHRYITGYAIAINSKGETVTVNLNDIMEKAKTLGASITPCEY